MSFTVSVMNFGDYCLHSTVVAQTPEHAQRIENVAEHARVGEHQDFAAGKFDAIHDEKALDILAQRLRSIAEVVSSIKSCQRPQQHRQLR